MVTIKMLDAVNGAICIVYTCDNCHEVCEEMHEKSFTFFFICRKCNLTYVMPKQFTCCEGG